MIADFAMGVADASQPMRTLAAPLLEVQRLSVTYATRHGPLPAVSEVSIHLDRAECLCIVGESGCGKSAMALAIMGLAPAELSGQVLYRGGDLVKLSSAQMEHVRGKEIGMIFQDPMSSLNPQMPIGSQIAEGLRHHERLSRAAADDRSVELLNLVGLPSPRSQTSRYPHELSGGMRQRVMIAIALSCRPTILIADEPTTALDVTIQAQILDLIARLRREFSMATMLISHDLGVVAGLADRVGIMYAGRIVESGDADEVFERPRHPYTQALLESIPRLDRPRRTALRAIEGAPPTPSVLATGCPFRSRCPLFRELQEPEICTAVNPGLQSVGEGHTAACHFAKAET